MKRAVTFAGGGSKGSYQFGAWTAFNELGYEFDIATGTSIGSINAGFYVQHDYDAAKEFWETLTMDGVMVNGINLDGKLISVAEEMDSVKPFIKSYLNFKGADITPFRQGLRKYTNEDKFFSSDIDYGMMTVKFPSLTPLEVLKKDIFPGMLAEWINTSCACFPVFPLAVISGQSYIDGGYYDNLPISTAFNLGAQEVYAVDLRDECCHPVFRSHPFVKYIYPSRSLGSFMCFEHDAMMRNLEQGYRDTLKFFRRLYGKKYSFTIKQEDMQAVESDARRFTSATTPLWCSRVTLTAGRSDCRLSAASSRRIRGSSPNTTRECTPKTELAWLSAAVWATVFSPCASLTAPSW